MASNKNGSKDGGSKTGSDPSGTKKPTAMLDLKATEVKNEKAGEVKNEKTGDAGQPKPASTGSTTGAAPAAAGKPGSQAAGKPGDKPTTGTPSTGPSSGVPPTGAPAAGSPASSQASTLAGSRAPAGGGGGKDDGGKAGGGGGGNGNGNGGKGSSDAEPSRRSGGGFASVLSHVVAGIIGGAIVVFGAGPLSKQLGVDLMPPAKLPASVQSRLAAVEKAANVRPEPDLSAVMGDIDANRKKLAALNELQTQVAELATAQQKLAETAAASPKGAAEASAEVVDDMATRLARLEETLKTLSQATGPDGDKNALAKLASISGKLSDLERTMNNQLEALRKGVMTELETRVGKTAEASAAAQAGTERIDRELAGVKTNAARFAQRMETLKASNTRLADLVRAVQEQAARIEVELSSLKGDVQQQFKSVARPKDVSSALAPVSEKLSTLDNRLQTIVEREEARKTNAKRIVLALELANLKRVLDRGGPYAAELDAVRTASDGNIDLAALEKFESSGVPTATELGDDFRTLAFRAINADGGGTPQDGKPAQDGEPSIIGKLLAGAKSMVRVRRTTFDRDDTSTEAIVARMEKLLKEGNLNGALEESKKLSKEARAPIRDWLDRLRARARVEQAIAQLENQLKASLGGAPAAPAKEGTKG